MIAVIDYDIGNVAAVVNMLQRLGFPSVVTSRPEEIVKADRIVLPGNGAFDACIKNLHSSNLVPVLEEQVLHRRIPILGICVGAQMLGNGSAEGILPGLGWVDMFVERFPAMPGLRIPHMGWDYVEAKQTQHPLAQGMTFPARFYFVHGYYMVPKVKEEVLFESNYGINFAAGIARDHIMGVQFHPEKSHRFGMKLMSAFAKGF